VRLDVRLTAEAAAAHPPGATTVLVIDVLRASTTIIAALTSGCRAVVPVADVDEARHRARAFGPAAVIAGERRGEPLAGFDLGNSPLEFTADRVHGRVVILTTSNGTRALLAVRAAAAVGVAALVNLQAAAGWALAQSRDVVAVCAGERGALSLEDHVCAGLLMERLLREEPGAELSPAALEALAAGRRYGKDVARLAEDSTWARHLTARGRGADVAACLMLDTTTLVPVLAPGVDNVVVGSR
jgi:2-phosphosulfolactate phosphatase